MDQELDHQMLILWMKLSGAVKQFAADKNISYFDVEPWNCDSTEIQGIWTEITKPQHLAHLEASVSIHQNMIIDPKLRDLNVKRIQAALEECKKRQN